MNRSELKEIVISQNSIDLHKSLIVRDNEENLEKYVNNNYIIVIRGIRRSGKSTILKKIKSIYSGYYLNFDDERLINFKLEDFELLNEIFIELYGKKNFFYFDEIQNITHWERYVRRINDEGKKIFITGSNATMLSRELGTHLTGRYLEIDMYPFSFNEFLKFNGVTLNKDSLYETNSKVLIYKYFEEYLLVGGFPEYLTDKNPDYLKLLYENIIYRDILVRYSLSSEKNFKDLVYFSVTNLSKEISFNSITKVLNISSPTTIKDYYSYLENSYLIFLIPRFNYSVKKQLRSTKKLYIIDNALAVHLGFRFSKDIGKLLENMIFLELKRRKEEIFFFLEENECDFIIRKGLNITNTIQVCAELTKDNKDREIKGLLGAMNKFKLNKGTIITLDKEEEITINKKKIKIIPAWKWMLEDNSKCALLRKSKTPP
jgi:predicted AAA+ superfamily ATPase